MPVCGNVSERIVAVYAARFSVFVRYHGNHMLHKLYIHKNGKNILGVCKLVVLRIAYIKPRGLVELAGYFIAVAPVI